LIFLVAATLEKANTYVFAAPIIRDREVGGSNPLAPTNSFKHLRLPAKVAVLVFVWVFEQETDVDELLAKTERTLESVQALKQAASKLKNNEPESYLVLLLTLKDFAEQHRAEIDSLHEYVS
jgi:hypothetical protein